MSLIVRAGKFAKKVLLGGRSSIPNANFMGLSRRIDRVMVGDEKIVGMTFDDGPCALPPSPDRGEGGEGLTDRILGLLAARGARATFDVVGDTSGNYPDRVGSPGQATWGGIAYDHYPLFEQDAMGGAKHRPELIARILAGGHEISSHTNRHILFGRKNFVYGGRVTWRNLDEVLADLRALHGLIEAEHHYEMKLSRPPHYVDRVAGGFTSYDAYDLMGYQYMGASFEGGGWLPLGGGYPAEVEAMSRPLGDALALDEKALCGRIIFEKDGYNMASRSPVADGLGPQLELFEKYGYKVLPVGELMGVGQFADIGRGHPAYAAAERLVYAGRCVAYRDNTVRPNQPITRGEYAMLFAPRPVILARIGNMQRGEPGPFRDMKTSHPYSSAAAWAVESGLLTAPNGLFRPNEPMKLTRAEAAGSAR